MRRLIIRNVGPVKSVDVQLNKVNVFIGPQSSGKSTIAKVLSTCSWVEKEVATTMNDSFVADTDAFIALMSDFHKMTKYFDDASEILFETEVVRIALKGKEFSLQLKDQEAYHREKICYVPSERNSVTLPELQGFEFGQTNLRSFLFDWYNAREFYNESNKTDILNLGVRYYYDPNELRLKDRIEHINGKTYEIPLGSASSGLQSVVPLQIMMQYYAGQYFDSYGEKTSFDTEAKTKQIRRKLTDMMVLQKLFPGQFKPEERSRFIQTANELLHKGDEKAKQLLKEYNAAVERLTVPTRTSFIIEEPEQNLFPRTQMDLLFYLLSQLNHGRNHRLVMTTHSPYILYALNNCLLAYLVKDTIDEEAVPLVESLKYPINPADVSVWSIKDGCLVNDKGEPDNTIQDNRGLIRKNYFNDVMKDVMSEFNTLLTFME